MFKVGDKVVRRPTAHLGIWDSYEKVGTVKHVKEPWFAVVGDNSHCSWLVDNFMLASEAVTMRQPKFKAGDLVKSKLSNCGAIITGIITEITFKYKTDNTSMPVVREERLELTNLPRHICIEGIIYREVL